MNLEVSAHYLCYGFSFWDRNLATEERRSFFWNNERILLGRHRRHDLYDIRCWYEARQESVFVCCRIPGCWAALQATTDDVRVLEILCRECASISLSSREFDKALSPRPSDLLGRFVLTIISAFRPGFTGSYRRVG